MNCKQAKKLRRMANEVGETYPKTADVKQIYKIGKALYKMRKRNGSPNTAC